VSKEEKNERLCNGCFIMIAPFDADTFRVGAQWFHNRNCQQKMLDRSYQIYLKRMKWKPKPVPIQTSVITPDRQV
jgi:hypothetical protein